MFGRSSVFLGGGFWEASFPAGVRYLGLPLGALGLWLAYSAPAQSVEFGLDTGTPPTHIYQNLPLDQTAGGVTAHFSAVSGSFSVQTDSTTGFKLSQFSGHYLYPNVLRGSVLRIQFSVALTEISLTFATTDYPDSEGTTPLVLSAYASSAATVALGSTTNRAAFGTDSYPMGSLTFSSEASPFDRVELRIPVGGDATFLVDNIVVTPVADATPELDVWVAGPGAVAVSWP
jgi:hypothetical protein